MKKVGFIDFYLSEWHANNYPQWIRDAAERLGAEYTVAYAWGEQEVSPVDGVTNAAWCEKMGVTLCDTIEAVCEQSDVLFILAPSNPEKHLPYAKKVLTYGKPTYIDKTFAPDQQQARAIFALAKQHNTPFFSTSALRYADELKEVEGSGLTLMGDGSNFPEYIIHLVEMAVALTPDAFTRVKVLPAGCRRLCCLETAANETVGILYNPGMPYGLSWDAADGTHQYRGIASNFFLNLMEDILRFFEEGKQPFDPAQTLKVMAVRDALLKAEAACDTWVNVE